MKAICYIMIGLFVALTIGQATKGDLLWIGIDGALVGIWIFLLELVKKREAKSEDGIRD